MGKGYLIDSNSVIDFFNYSLTDNGINFLLSIDPVISVITQIEVFGKSVMDSSERKAIQSFIDLALIYDVDNKVALRAIDLRVKYNLRVKYKIKLPDAVIAATALHYNLTLFTRNVSDFNKIEGLEIIDPHSI